MTGILLKAIAGFYYIEAGGNVYESKARGVFRKNHESPTVGDTLEFELIEENKAIVLSILKRKNLLVKDFFLLQATIPLLHMLILEWRHPSTGQHHLTHSCQWP